MALLDESAWRGKVFLGGWTAGGGGEAAGHRAGHRRGDSAGPASRRPPRMSRRRPRRPRRPSRPGPRPRTPSGPRSCAGRPTSGRAHAAEIEQWDDPRDRQDPARGAVRDARRHRGDLRGGHAADPARTASCCPASSRSLSCAERVPVGVVGVIAPFNFPQILAIRSVAPALALGNAVVLKPDPRTAVCGGVVLARVFEEAGLPEGLLHVLPGGAGRRRGADHRPAGPGDLVHRLHRGRPPGRRAGRPSTSSGCTWSSAATRR